MPPTSLQSKLRGMKGKWKSDAARAKAEGLGVAVPDGKYRARLTGGSVEDSGGLRMKLQFTILEGDHEGTVVTKNDGLEGERSLEFTARTLARFGYDPEEVEIDQLPAVVAELVKAKPVCGIQTRATGDFVNVYVNSVESDSGSEEDEEEETISEGSRVSGMFRGIEYTGTVKEVVDEETVRVTRDDTGAVIKVKAENLSVLPAEDAEGEEEAEEEAEETEEAPADEEEEVELAEGMRVSFPWRGTEETGEVTSIVDDETAKVRKDSDGKVAVVKIENLTLEEGEEAPAEEEEEVEEAPAPPARRGPGRPPKTATAAPEPAPKRGPGRPPKNAPAAAKPAAVALPARRGPGRPAKK